MKKLFIDKTKNKDDVYKFEVCCSNCRYSCTFYKDEPCTNCVRNRKKSNNIDDNWTAALPYEEEGK